MIIVLLFPVMVMEVDNANDEDNSDGSYCSCAYYLIICSRTSQKLLPTHVSRR